MLRGWCFAYTEITVSHVFEYCLTPFGLKRNRLIHHHRWNQLPLRTPHRYARCAHADLSQGFRFMSRRVENEDNVQHSILKTTFLTLLGSMETYGDQSLARTPTWLHIPYLPKEPQPLPLFKFFVVRIMSFSSVTSHVNQQEMPLEKDILQEYHLLCIPRLRGLDVKYSRAEVRRTISC